MNIIRGLKKYKNTLDTLAIESNNSRCALYLDSIWARLRYGCVLNHYVVGCFYKLSSFERKKTFTYRHWSKVVATVNKKDYIHYLKEKRDFNTYFHDFIGREWLYTATMTFADFASFCKRRRGAIIKPVDGLEGDGVYYELLPTDDVAIENKFKSLKSKHLLIEERIVQHPDMVFGNKSVNTIRIYTVRSNSNKVTVVKTVVRAGIGESIVDNSHSGGCAYEVDKEFGYIVSPYYAANGDCSYIHPGTDICMLGRKIPYWENVLALCVRAANRLPECRYIGWDVAITKDGPILIEGNHMPDLDMIEFVGSHGFKDAIIKGLGL